MVDVLVFPPHFAFAEITGSKRVLQDSGTPVRKRIWIDINAHDDMPVSFEAPFHLLGNFNQSFQVGGTLLPSGKMLGSAA